MSETRKLSREELYKMVWEKPAIRIANDLGISDVMVGKLCRKLNVPKPPRGYWQRVENNHKVKPTPLPKESAEFQKYVYLSIPTTIDISPQLQTILDHESLSPNPIIPKDLNDAHSLIKKTERFCKEEYDDDDEMIYLPEGEGYLDISISGNQLNRALQIMNAVITACLVRNYTVAVEVDYWRSERTLVKKDDAEVEISIREKTKETQRELTDEEKKKPPYLLNIPKQIQPQGKLTFKIKPNHSTYKVWNDRKNENLEARLAEIIFEIVFIIEFSLEEKRQKDLEKKRQIEIQQKIKEEENRRQKLLSDAEMWRKTENIREFIKACERRLIEKAGSISPGSKEAKWIEWAYKYADSIDPIDKLFEDNKSEKENLLLEIEDENL